ncbi:GSU2403 family nucleotidyltransferase fold protein [Burkholderia gladioli]|uniref:GSU2403 family nucleotidyltransferase fold protein n=1 Tax=Burkholderia gladioli TaxID=28095 RepID=UPI0016410BA4|nr:GSU2403 family nucleotidyltransferase fold protein [Burkholderia gladioli]MBU9167620.1 nucleotidyltransferase domain-containing protein [Burkholderia gladioli]MBU9379547.1 nucleotidyltransferase domain-containing protein [Burkholderia gladioli]MDN7923533.1 GSU2403 family nucleotidyltransferase fold protein [Burkholderia gladioli]
MNDLEPFARLAAALAPWRDQIVYVGGWAHRLYRLHPLATADPRFRPIATLDADIAFDEHTRFQGSMKDALLAAGFREQLCGEYRPPVAKYTLGDERHGFYAEFLTTLSGSGRTRQGAPSVTLDASGISAQKLRRFSLLMALPRGRHGRAPGSAPWLAHSESRELHRAENPDPRRAAAAAQARPGHPLHSRCHRAVCRSCKPARGALAR